jgi:hypothetical protein
MKGSDNMKTIVIVLTMVIFLISGLPAFAMQGHDGKDKSAKTDGGMGDMGFKHEAVVDGVRSEFQIMSLASMKMKDDQGKTHHIMVKLVDDKTKAEIKSAVGKIKIIAPDGAEQLGALKNYNGIFAANFTFTTEGKYGVICLLKMNNEKKVIKFWYNHHG